MFDRTWWELQCRGQRTHHQFLPIALCQPITPTTAKINLIKWILDTGIYSNCRWTWPAVPWPTVEPLVIDYEYDDLKYFCSIIFVKFSGRGKHSLGTPLNDLLWVRWCWNIYISFEMSGSVQHLLGFVIIRVEFTAIQEISSHTGSPFN